MATLSRRGRRQFDIWPGFVDALANLLIVIIFVLLIFVLAQFFLGETLSGRDAALRRLEQQVTELADLLALERREAATLSGTVARLTQELEASLSQVETLKTEAANLAQRTTEADARAAERERALEGRTEDVARLATDIAALKALKEQLEREAAALTSRAETAETALGREKELSAGALAQVALLNQQMAALRDQLASLTALLDAADAKAKAQEAQITSLGQRLNAALASKVQELSRYRSEFFGRLREVLGDHAGIRIIGDRFVFQSEVLFATGSAELGTEGRRQILQVADALKELSPRIPAELDWILQVEGHTDRVPIATAPFPSNWELSQARAMSVLRLLLEAGIPAKRLSAAGFGEFQPLDDQTDEAALRRNRRIELKLTQR
jgi:chemotaxis protein MotB